LGALAELVLSYICREVAGWADDLRDTQERLDFAERMPSAGSDRGAPVIEEAGSTSTVGI